MLSDEILSKEAFFIYNYTAGFIPYQNRLDHWVGTFRDASGIAHTVEVIMAPDFPNSPPIVKIDGISIEDIDLPFRLRTLERWNIHSHLFHVMVEITEQFKKFVINTNNVRQKVIQPVYIDEKTVLEQQVQELQTRIAQKRHELEQIRSNSAAIASKDDIRQMIEEGINQLEAEVFMLEKQFERAEMETEEFVRKYIDTLKRLETLKLQKQAVIS